MAKVGYRKYKSVSRSAFGLSGKSKKVLAVIRTSGGGWSGERDAPVSTAGSVGSAVNARKGGLMSCCVHACVQGPSPAQRAARAAASPAPPSSAICGA